MTRYLYTEWPEAGVFAVRDTMTDENYTMETQFRLNCENFTEQFLCRRPLNTSYNCTATYKAQDLGMEIYTFAEL